ncbi:MAG: O-antigen ligase family protein, partial [Elusimicrobia bacterium]|nr:O-antigen ligase family protein [Elusimicrobiota bacterium]
MTSRPSRAVVEALVLAAVASGPFLFGAVEPWSEAVIVTLGAAAGIAALLRGEPSSGGAKALAAGFAALTVWAALESLHPVSATAPAPFLPHTVDPLATRVFASRMAACAGVAWAGGSVYSDERARARLARVLAGLGVVVAAAGMIQLSQGNAKLLGLRQTPSTFNPFGPYYNPNHGAAMLSFALFAGAGLWRERRKRLRGSWRGGVGRASDAAASLALSGAGLAVIAAGMFFTRSRGAAACAVFAAGVWAAGGGPRRRAAAAATTAALIGAAAWWAWGRYPTLADSFDIRVSIWKRTLALIADAPMFGRGLGAFAAPFPAYQPYGVGGLVLQAHCDPLQLAAEGGLAGALVAAAALAGFARSWEDSRGDAVLQGLRWGLAAFALNSLVEFNGEIAGNLILAAGVAAAAGASRPVAAEGAERALWRPRLAASAALAAAALATFPRAVAWFLAGNHALIVPEAPLSDLRAA